MTRDRNRTRYAKSSDKLKSDLDDDAKGVLDVRVGRLVRRFGNTAVKEALNKRWKADGKTEDDNSARFQKMQHLWLTVEIERRRTVPMMTAADACRNLADRDGVAVFEAGDPSIGIWPRVRGSRIRAAETIEREFKRAEQLRRGSEQVDHAWQNMLADRTGQPRSSVGGIGWRNAPCGSDGPGEREVDKRAQAFLIENPDLSVELAKKQAAEEIAAEVPTRPRAGGKTSQK